jgi:addiction module HigA family antidote
MSNYIEYGDRVAFHPGYYIKEIIDDSGLTQADFARRLGTTPKNISVLIKGDQALSVDIANKLSRMLGTSITYWMNLQQAYDELNAEFMRLEDLEKERNTFKMIDYGYFRDHLGFPDLTRKVDEQIERVRKFLAVASLTVLEERDLAVDFRSYKEDLSLSNIVNSNVMLQIAINETLNAEIPQYDKKKFENCLDYVLQQTRNHDEFLSETKEVFGEAGVYLVVLPNLKNSGISGATKRVNGKVMIFVNDRRHYEDTFWFTLFHEIGHVLNGNLGASSENEAEADEFARRKLIPEEEYIDFISTCKSFNEKNIKVFADSIDRDPGIVLGRLLIEHKVAYSDTRLCNRLRHTFDCIRS